jgi:hypothetical protein
MRTIKLTYEIKSANGFWNRKEYVTDDGKDYERIVNVIHSNPSEYRVINVEHIEEDLIMNITKEQVAKLKDAYESNKEILREVEEHIEEYGMTDDGLTDATESFEQGYNNALEFVFRVLEDSGEEEIMGYEMKVAIAKDGNEKERTLNCWFSYDEEQYGNGHYVSIKGKDFSPQYFDIRYDRSFNRSNKSKWLEEWARSYWSGENGAWSIKEIDIIPIKEQF